MKWTLTLVAIFTLASALLAGWFGHTGALTIGFLAFALLLFAANLDRISEIRASGTGIEAKTREVVQRAEHTLTELQSLASIVAATTLSLVNRSGRLGGYDDAEEEQIRSELMRVLTEIGVSEAQRAKTLRDWHRFTHFDYVLYILGGNRIPEGFDDSSIQSEWKALRSIEHIPTPEQLREFLAKCELLTPEREAHIEDFEYYLEHGSHRRPDEWRRRNEWGQLNNPNNQIQATR